MKVVALAGGVGGAKLAHGLALNLPPEDLTIIVNTGDDFVHFGLHISPDLDTVCYTLAGLADPVMGWGRAGDTSNLMEELAQLSSETWFHLGDRDLATHLERTRLLACGQSLTDITRTFCKQWGVAPAVLPMSNDPVRTVVRTVEYGDLAFQEYFVKHACIPTVTGFLFQGSQNAQAAPGVLESLEQADLIVICPSNPWVSIEPILSVGGIREAVKQKGALAVSPIIAGKTVKGPAAKMFIEAGWDASAVSVARYYQGLLWGFIYDSQDHGIKDEIEGCGIISLELDTIMRSVSDRTRLAKQIIDFWTAHKA